MINEINSVNPATRSDSNGVASGEARRASLERARRDATASQVANAEVEQEQRAEQFQRSNEIISRAIGANTRLEISTGEGNNPFVYRAIDIDSGEVVSEWPPAQFANLIATLGASSPATGTIEAGLVVDEQA